MADIIDWLTQQRDKHAERREAAFKLDDWGTVNIEDEYATRLFEAITEITAARKRLRAMERVLVRRVLVAAGEKP